MTASGPEKQNEDGEGRCTIYLIRDALELPGLRADWRTLRPKRTGGMDLYGILDTSDTPISSFGLWRRTCHTGLGGL
jgi:hypothetical protein